MYDTIPVRTNEIAPPWLKPSVPSLHLNFRARLRRRKNRFLASAFVADIKAGYRRSLTILGAFAIAYGCLVIIRGAWYAGVLLGVAR